MACGFMRFQFFAQCISIQPGHHPITDHKIGYVCKGFVESDLPIFGSYDLALILTAFVLGFGALIWLKIDPTQELVPDGQTEHSKA